MTEHFYNTFPRLGGYLGEALSDSHSSRITGLSLRCELFWSMDWRILIWSPGVFGWAVSTTMSEKRKSRAPASWTTSPRTSRPMWWSLRLEAVPSSCHETSSASLWVRSKSSLVIWNQGKLRKGWKRDGFAAADESRELVGDLNEEIFEDNSLSGLANNVFHAGAHEHIYCVISTTFQQDKLIHLPGQGRSRRPQQSTADTQTKSHPRNP